MKIGREIKESWSEIKELQAARVLQRVYNPGDYKLVDLGELGVIRMRFAGSQNDVNPNEEPVDATWIAADPTKKGLRWSHTPTGEYSKSDLRAWLNEALYTRLPEDLKEIIVPVVKRQVAYDPKYDCYTDEVCDVLWIPSFSELFDGGYPELFSNNESRALGQPYWTRSASGTCSVYKVNEHGAICYSETGFLNALILGFSI